MKAIQITCPSCRAQAGEKCIDVGIGDDARNKSGVHVDRASRARYITTAERRSKRAAERTL